MRTSVRAAFLAAAAGLSLVAATGPAQAAAVFVETNPSTVRVGDEVGLRASCTDNLVAATVTSDAFGSVTVEPSFGFLTATTRVPATVDPGDYLLGDDPDGVVRAVERAYEAGREGESDEVMLLHDNQRQTAEALPDIIDHCEESGRRFAGVDELLADKYLEP